MKTTPNTSEFTAFVTPSPRNKPMPNEPERARKEFEDRMVRLFGSGWETQHYLPSQVRTAWNAAHAAGRREGMEEAAGILDSLAAVSEKLATNDVGGKMRFAADQIRNAAREAP